MDVNHIDAFLNRNGLTPKINLAILNPIVRDMFLGEYYMPGETIAKCLSLFGWLDLYFLSATTEWDGEKLSQEDVAQFVTGFVYINFNIQRGYLSSNAGLDKYREILREKDALPPFNVNDDYLVLAFSLLNNDPWGLEYADIVFQTEAEKKHNTYFRIGLEVGYRTYKKYVETCKLMNISEISQLNNILDIQKLQKILSGTVSQVKEKASENNFHTTHIINRRNSEAENVVLDKKVEEVIDEIARMKKEGNSVKNFELQWQLWEKLISIPGLSRYYAFYTFAHLSAGDFLEKAYKASSHKEFIQKAKNVYSVPLYFYTFWANDPGTRYACDYKMLNLLVEHFHTLDITNSTCSSLIYKHGLDAIKTNERMYINSTYDDSRAIIQGRVDDLVGILIEYAHAVSQTNRESSTSNEQIKETLTIVENNKSRLLNLEISLLDIKTPAGPKHLYEKESECLKRLRSIRARQHGFFEPKEHKAGLDDLTEFANKRLELEEIWSELESVSKETQKYVSFRRDGISYTLDNGRQHQSLQHLGNDTGILSFYMVQGRIYSLLTTPSTNKSYTNAIDISPEAFWGFIHSYNNEIIQRNDIGGKHYWQQLGDVLFSQLKKQISNIKRICIIPHRELHQLPLHALTIDGKPLIDEWEIFYVPSLKVLDVTTTRSTSKSSNLVMGYVPPDSDEPFRKAIEDEINTVAHILKTSPLSGDYANRDYISQHAGAKVMHIAGHGYFDEQYPLYSGVTLSDGVFTAKEWLNLSISAELVTLSACKTGLSNIKPGDELVGLARSVLFAGASSLLTSLWEVEGNSTRDWMVEFYKKVYNPSGNIEVEKASAFRQATLEIKREYKNPYYWAPFVLIGNPK